MFWDTVVHNQKTNKPLADKPYALSNIHMYLMIGGGSTVHMSRLLDARNPQLFAAVDSQRSWELQARNPVELDKLKFPSPKTSKFVSILSHLKDLKRHEDVRLCIFN